MLNISTKGIPIPKNILKYTVANIDSPHTRPTANPKLHTLIFVQQELSLLRMLKPLIIIKLQTKYRDFKYLIITVQTTF